MNKLVYIADDDIICRDLIHDTMAAEGYKVEAFETGDQLYIAFLNKACDLIILDVVMPGTNGIKICAMLRAISEVPVIILTSLDTDEDYVSAISQGGDVYLTKPFSPAQLRVNVKALLAKAQKQQQASIGGVIKYGDIAVYPSQILISRGDDKIKSTKTEFKVFLYMLENHPRVISRDELLNNVWGFGSIVETRAIDNVIKRLRRKLADAGSTVTIETVWGEGFRLGAQ